MSHIALTGGIGSEKPTVAETQAAKGAVHLNADAYELQHSRRLFGAHFGSN